MNFRLSTQDSHVNFINISQGMLISARLDVSKSPTRNLGSTTKVRSRQCRLFRTNDGPAALPVAVSKSCERYKGSSRKPVLGSCVWPKTITRCPSGPCSHQRNQTLQISHNLQTAWSPSTWLTLLGRNNPYYPFFFFLQQA